MGIRMADLTNVFTVHNRSHVNSCEQAKGSNVHISSQPPIWGCECEHVNMALVRGKWTTKGLSPLVYIAMRNREAALPTCLNGQFQRPEMTTPRTRATKNRAFLTNHCTFSPCNDKRPSATQFGGQ